MIDVSKKTVIYLFGIFLAFWIGFAIHRAFFYIDKYHGDYSRIVERKVIRVCGENDLFSYYSDNEGEHGFHYEMAKAFADIHKLKLEYKTESNFQKRLKMLETGKCDFITGPLPVITELHDNLIYTENIYRSRLMLIQRKKQNNIGLIRNQTRLSGKPVYVPEGSPYISRLKSLSSEISDSITIRNIPVFGNEQLISLVSMRFCDFAICDEMVADSYLAKYYNIDVETPLSFNQFHAWAVKHGSNRLLDSLDMFISRYKKSPEFTRLFQKYTIKN